MQGALNFPFEKCHIRRPTFTRHSNFSVSFFSFFRCWLCRLGRRCLWILFLLYSSFYISYVWNLSFPLSSNSLHTHTMNARKKKDREKKNKKKNLFTDKSGSCVIHLHTAFYFLIAIRYTERQCRSEISLFFVNIHRFGPQKPTHNSESTVKRTKIYLKMWEKSRKKSIDCVPFDVRQCINLAGSRVTACVQRRRENHAPTVVNKFTIHSFVRLFFLPFLTHTGARFPPE